MNIGKLKGPRKKTCKRWENVKSGDENWGYTVFPIASRAGSDGSMSASGSAGLGLDLRWGSKFSFENFQPWGFLITRLYITVLDKIPNPSAVCMLSRHIVLLIVIRPSDGDFKPGGPLGAFLEEQAMSRHRVSHYPSLSSSSHTTQLHYTNSYTYSHPYLNFLQYSIQILIPHVM